VARGSPETCREILETLAAHRDLLQRFGVRELRLFGSAVRGEAAEASDIDLLVEYDQRVAVGLFEFVRLQRALSELLGRPVDLATPEALHPALRERILQEAVRVA
jgi:predicted nucleotidyltransferase